MKLVLRPELVLRSIVLVQKVKLPVVYGNLTAESIRIWK